MPGFVATDIQLSAPPTSTKALDVTLKTLGTVVIFGLVAHLAMVLWARHEFTQVESIVALHANMLAEDGRLYYNLNAYPFTVSPYGPVFYTALAAAHKLGVPLFTGGRCLSFAALLVLLWLVKRALEILVKDPRARRTGLILAAGSANLLAWGTVSQVDTVALCFAFAAFVQYLEWTRRRETQRLVLAGVLIVLAVFTKQTALAAAATIGLLLLIEDQKKGAAWTIAVATSVLTLAFALNSATHGNYLANAVKANLVPFSPSKLLTQLHYFVTTAGWLLAVALAGMRAFKPLYLYTTLAIVIFLATAAKIGSDLNYQLETTLLLALCAAFTLDTLNFFPRLLQNDKSWITLLQLPLLLYLTVNAALTGRILLERFALEGVKRAEFISLRPYLSPERGPVLSTTLDPLLYTRGRMEVEPDIYTLLVHAGATNPIQLTQDLAATRFGTIILYENVFAPTPSWKNAEVPSLPASQLSEIRKHYRLVDHVEGPYLTGDFIYEPIQP